MDATIGGIVIAIVSALSGYFGLKYKSRSDLDAVKTTAEDKAAADLFGAYDKFVDRFSKQLDQERAEFERKLADAERRILVVREEWVKEREAILARMAAEQMQCDKRIAVLEAKVTSLIQSSGTEI